MNEPIPGTAAGVVYALREKTAAARRTTNRAARAATQVRGDTTRTGLVIEHLERLTLSVNGNPRFLVHFTDGTVARTMSDASLGYVIENPEYRDVPLAVTFTVHGKIRHARPER